MEQQVRDRKDGRSIYNQKVGERRNRPRMLTATTICGATGVSRFQSFDSSVMELYLLLVKEPSIEVGPCLPQSLLFRWMVGADDRPALKTPICASLLRNNAQPSQQGKSSRMSRPSTNLGPRGMASMGWWWFFFLSFFSFLELQENRSIDRFSNLIFYLLTFFLRWSSTFFFLLGYILCLQAVHVWRHHSSVDIIALLLLVTINNLTT